MLEYKKIILECIKYIEDNKIECDINNVKKAHELACFAHEGQVRKLGC